MTILIVKLTCGTELIADVGESPDKPGAYFCSDILQILSDVSPNGHAQLGLADFMPYADPVGGFVVPSNMAALAMPSQELLEHYNRRFSKIIVPESKIQLA